MGISVRRIQHHEVQANEDKVTIFIDEAAGVGRIVRIQIADSLTPAERLDVSLNDARKIARLLSEALTAYDSAKTAALAEEVLR